MRSGWLTIARVSGAPVRLHVSLAIGALVASGLRFSPGAWAGYVVVLLVHELGHAALARRAGLRVVDVALHGLGGHCAYEGTPPPLTRAIVASGGVLAQLVLLAAALPAWWSGPRVGGWGDLLDALVRLNALVALLNLVPIAPLDGAQIAKLPGLLRAAWVSRRARAARRGVVEARRARGALELGAVDEDAVRETVRRALDEARRASRPPR